MKDHLPIGFTLWKERYRIVRHLKTGGQAIVYVAWDQNLDDQVIVKQAYKDEDWAHEAFRREAKILNNLEFSGLPRIIDSFIEKGSAYLVMRFIPGEDLDVLLKQKGSPFSISEVLGWADQLFGIVAYLHAQSSRVIHHDINPKNIRLRDGNRIYLLDFGIAKDTPTAYVHGGTPHYASPEQLKDEETDTRSDIYSLGATFYNLLTRSSPPDAITRKEAFESGLPDPLRPASEINPHVPQYVAQALMRAMALDPKERPVSVEAMRLQLGSPGKSAPRIEQDDDVTHISPSTKSSKQQSRQIIIELANEVTKTDGELLTALRGGITFQDNLIHIICELLDAPRQARLKVFERNSEIIKSAKAWPNNIAVSFIEELVSGKDPAPAVSSQLRGALDERLGTRAQQPTDQNVERLIESLESKPPPREYLKLVMELMNRQTGDGSNVLTQYRHLLETDAENENERLAQEVAKKLGYSKSIDPKLAGILKQRIEKIHPLDISHASPQSPASKPLEDLLMAALRGLIIGVVLFMGLLIAFGKSQILTYFARHIYLAHGVGATLCIMLVLWMRHKNRAGASLKASNKEDLGFALFFGIIIALVLVADAFYLFS